MKKEILYIVALLGIVGGTWGKTTVPLINDEVSSFYVVRTVEVKNVDNGCIEKFTVFKDGRDVTKYFSAQKRLLKENVLVLNLEDKNWSSGQFTVVVDYYNGKSLRYTANLN